MRMKVSLQQGVVCGLLGWLSVLLAGAAPLDRLPLSLDVNTTCVHTRAWARDHLNQVNLGVGLTGTLTPDWSVSAGFYRNSFRRLSAYALANWTPLHLLLPGIRLGAGLTAGFLTGYSYDENPIRPLAAGALLQRFDCTESPTAAAGRSGDAERGVGTTFDCAGAPSPKTAADCGRVSPFPT